MKSPESSTSCSALRLPLLSGLHAWKLSNTKASLGWNATGGLRCCSRGFHDALVAGYQKLVDAVEHENDMHRKALWRAAELDLGKGCYTAMAELSWRTAINTLQQTMRCRRQLTTLHLQAKRLSNERIVLMLCLRLMNACICEELQFQAWPRIWQASNSLNTH